MSNFYTNELSTANNTGCLTANNTGCLTDPEVTIPEEEDKNAFECDDCNSKGIDCYEQLGLTKEESLIYMDLGEPDRCEDCFDKWKNTSDAADYLKQAEEEEAEEEIGEEQFRCPSCKLVQSMSTCYLCDIENTCETCVGDGGSYGEDEEWICQPCVDKQPEEEEVEEYPFYIYHDASFGDDRDNCPACYGSYGDLSEEAIETIHDEYDDTDDIPCYSRQRLNAYLKPSTYKRLTAKTLNTNTVLFALANMGLWGECDEELGLDKLDDDEIVEDASDDLYVCYANGKEYDAHSYFREHKIHLCFGCSGSTEFAEWHDDGVHPQN